MVGIYEILNIVNGKRYIGQSLDISRRISTHKYMLNSISRDKSCNRHLYNSWWKYGRSSFRFNIVEICPEESLDDRELYWIEYFKTTCRDYGYNLRVDIKGRGVTHKETRELISRNNRGRNNPNYGNRWTQDMKDRMSKIKKEQYLKGEVKINTEACKKGAKTKKEMWERNPEILRKTSWRISNSNRKYDIAKLDYNTLEVIEVYRGRLDIMEKHPEYYVQAILGCCSGTKKSYKGFKWKYVERGKNNSDN